MVNLRNSLISILRTNVFKDPPLVHDLLPKKTVYTIIHLTFTFNQVTVMLVTFDSHYYKSYQYVYVSSRSELLFMITSLNMFVLQKRYNWSLLLTILCIFWRFVDINSMHKFNLNPTFVHYDFLSKYDFYTNVYLTFRFDCVTLTLSQDKVLILCLSFIKIRLSVHAFQ